MQSIDSAAELMQKEGEHVPHVSSVMAVDT